MTSRRSERSGSGSGEGLAEFNELLAADRARAMAAPVRWRILVLCRREPLTNKELADLLGVNSGSMLHHVRTLVSAGFLEPLTTRRGARNAVEIPYRSTRIATTVLDQAALIQGVLEQDD